MDLVPEAYCSIEASAPVRPYQWLTLAHKLQSALTGQASLLDDQPLDTLLQRTQAAPPPRPALAAEPLFLPDELTVEQARAAGAVHVGHHHLAAARLADHSAE